MQLLFFSQAPHYKTTRKSIPHPTTVFEKCCKLSSIRNHMGLQTIICNTQRTAKVLGSSSVAMVEAAMVEESRQ